MLVRLLPRTRFLMSLSYLQSQQLLLTLHPYLKSSISISDWGIRRPACSHGAQSSGSCRSHIKLEEIFLHEARYLCRLKCCKKPSSLLCALRCCSPCCLDLTSTC